MKEFSSLCAIFISNCFTSSALKACFTCTSWRNLKMSYRRKKFEFFNELRRLWQTSQNFKNRFLIQPMTTYGVIQTSQSQSNEKECSRHKARENICKKLSCSVMFSLAVNVARSFSANHQGPNIMAFISLARKKWDFSKKWKKKKKKEKMAFDKVKLQPLYASMYRYCWRNILRWMSYLPMGRTFEPVYIMIKKKTPVR